jgi:hypothetical protein
VPLKHPGQDRAYEVKAKLAAPNGIRSDLRQFPQ